MRQELHFVPIPFIPLSLFINKRSYALCCISILLVLRGVRPCGAWSFETGLIQVRQLFMCDALSDRSSYTWSPLNQSLYSRDLEASLETFYCRRPTASWALHKKS